MPVRNGENFVVAAVESVFAQTFADWELVVSDNASDDATPTLLADLARRDARLRVSRSAEGLPVVDNFNRAGGLATGQWIAFLCHDDLLLPDALRRVADAVTAPDAAGVGLVGLTARYLFDNGVLSEPPANSGESRRHAGPDYLRRMLVGRAPDPLPGMSNAVVRADAWRDLGQFDPRYMHCDTFLWFRLLLNHDYLLLPDPLAVVRIHRGQDSASLRRTHRSIREYRQFVPQFVRRHAAALGLRGPAVAAAKLRFVSVAATELLIRLYKRDFSGALGVFGEVPPVWHPLLAALCVRNGQAEWRRTREYRHLVPPEYLYP